MKTFCKFEPQIWLEIITSRDAKSACFKGSRTSCREIIFGIFWPNFGQKRSHHVIWRVPNPPGANPLVAERASLRSSQSCVTGGPQPTGNPYRFLSFFCIPGNPCATPRVTHGEGSFSYQGVSTRGVRHAPGDGCFLPISNRCDFKLLALALWASKGPISEKKPC